MKSKLKRVPCKGIKSPVTLVMLTRGEVRGMLIYAKIERAVVPIVTAESYPGRPSDNTIKNIARRNAEFIAKLEAALETFDYIPDGRIDAEFEVE